LELINELYYDARPNKSQDIVAVSLKISYFEIFRCIVRKSGPAFWRFVVSLHSGKAGGSLD